MTNYIINQDTIIFDPKYNEPLDISLIYNYTKLIFSDYALCDELFMSYENNNFDTIRFIGSYFN